MADVISLLEERIYLAKDVFVVAIIRPENVCILGALPGVTIYFPREGFRPFYFWPTPQLGDYKKDKIKTLKNVKPALRNVDYWSFQQLDDEELKAINKPELTQLLTKLCLDDIILKLGNEVNGNYKESN